MQEGEIDTGDTTNYRVRMTEAAGTPPSLLPTNNNPWGNRDCESFCTICNPEEEKIGQKDELRFLKDVKGIYVGESSRSLYERTKEHVADREGLKEESHQVKHWLLDLRDLQEPPPFKFRLIGSFKDPMSRQLSEAVRIELRGSSILNSKSEFNRCRVPRLRVDLEGWKEEKREGPSSQLEGNHEMEAEFSLEEREVKKE